MRLFTSVVQGSFLLLLLVALSANAYKDDISDEALAALTLSDAVHDLLSLESTESKVYALPGTKIRDSKPAESKTILKFSSLRKLTPSPSYEIKLQNVSKEDYKVLKWYSVPKDESKKKVINGKDLTAQSSSYPEEYSDSYHDDYSSDQSPQTISSFHFNGEPPKTEEYKKPRKRVRKPCSRSKNKISKTNPESSDTTIVHSRSKDGLEYSSHYHDTQGRMPAPLPSPYYQDLMKIAKVPLGHVSTRISGQHLHGIPKYDTLNHMHKEDGNHFHLHNHHHHYGADGKKIEVAPKTNSYATLLAGLGNLRNMMSSVNPGSLYPKINLDNLKDMLGKTAIGPLNQNAGDSYSSINGYNSGSIGPLNHNIGNTHSSIGDYDSGAIGPDLGNSYSSANGYNSGTIGNSHSSISSYESGEKASNETPKKGYHYTGPHKSYGRKTYHRYRDGERPHSSEIGPNMDGNIGAEMYKHGIGPYSTDEYHDSKKHYPNEVTYAVDKDPHHNDGYGSYGNNYNDHKDEHVIDSYSSSKGPHSSYPSVHSHHDSNYPPHSHEHKDGAYSPDSEGKAPYSPSDYESPGPSNFESNRYSSHNPPVDSHSQEGYHDSPNNPHDHHHSAEIHNSPPGSHTTSYSGGVEEIPYDPEKEHLYEKMKPDPDPLTIPKNARIIEHHIRLHPKYYAMYRQPVIDIETHPNYPVPVHKPFTQAISQASYPLPVHKQFPRVNYPVPVHKLIPNPLKGPIPIIPRAPLAMHHNLNHMLHAYQSRSLYHKWW
ncbi:uncharacterized protein [Parasteatoda tepidariorum]|uniref:uncharacterized protein n=1 Tax=Parasteatoda tepidariorum TaxID=114398 RepID=UPI001C71A67E|nr:uncharacterized protein LOC107445620 [Parasteatoda tepidariorum]